MDAVFFFVFFFSNLKFIKLILHKRKMSLKLLIKSNTILLITLIYKTKNVVNSFFFFFEKRGSEEHHYKSFVRSNLLGFKKKKKKTYKNIELSLKIFDNFLH